MRKTREGRFIEKRVLLGRHLTHNLISLAKKRNGLSYPQLALVLGVSSQMLSHDWITDNRTIPESIFSKLFELAGLKDKNKLLKKAKILEPFWGQKISNGNSKYKKIVFPNRNSKKFAEFYGIMLGDGCVYSNLRGLSISGDKFLDYFYYHHYLRDLVYELFGVYPSIYTSKKDRSIKCVVNSTLLAKYLINQGFPAGVKYIQEPIIPKFININRENLSFCIRGLMDTDGSLSAHPHSKVMIHLSITIKSLRECVLQGLQKLGIKGGEFNKGIMIYGKDKIDNFKEMVGFSNYKNIYKYDQFIRNGKVPSSKEAEMFIRDKAGV